MFDFSWFGSISFDGFLPALLSSTRHDFGWLGWISFDYTFLSALLSIVLIDLVLAGDNAVVIALAVRNLPGKTKTWGIILGAGAAVMLRVVWRFSRICRMSPTRSMRPTTRTRSCSSCRRTSATCSTPTV